MSLATGVVGYHVMEYASGAILPSCRRVQIEAMLRALGVFDVSQMPEHMLI